VRYNGDLHGLDVIVLWIAMKKIMFLTSCVLCVLHRFMLVPLSLSFSSVSPLSRPDLGVGSNLVFWLSSQTDLFSSVFVLLPPVWSGLSFSVLAQGFSSSLLI
jgi:disulfide bond formation protein DsbB